MCGWTGRFERIAADFSLCLFHFIHFLGFNGKVEDCRIDSDADELAASGDWRVQASVISLCLCHWHCGRVSIDLLRLGSISSWIGATFKANAIDAGRSCRNCRSQTNRMGPSRSWIESGDWDERDCWCWCYCFGLISGRPFGEALERGRLEPGEMEGGCGGSDGSDGVVSLEPRPFRPFKSSEEYLIAMKEDLAEWLQRLYPHLHIDVDNFVDVLEDGVVLCKVVFFFLLLFLIVLLLIAFPFHWFSFVCHILWGSSRCF